MPAPDRITLCFDESDDTRLTRLELQPPNGAPSHVSFDRLERRHSGPVFSWKSGAPIHALALAWVRHAIAERGSGSRIPLLADGRAAVAIDQLCYKEPRAWLARLLGPNARNLLNKWFERVNQSNHKLPRSILTRVPEVGGPWPLIVRVICPRGEAFSLSRLKVLEKRLATTWENAKDPALTNAAKHDFLSQSSTAVLGREAELTRLSEWFSAEPRQPVLQVVAPGGRGKTALVRAWLDQLPETVPVLAWSFYRQGYGSEAIQSLQHFYSAAEKAWGCQMPAQATPNEVAVALARGFLARGGLLVLDGMEAITDSRGRQRNDLFGLLLNALEKMTDGDAARSVKILITSRIRIVGTPLLRFPQHTLELLPLADSTSRKLLRSRLASRFPDVSADWLAHTAAACHGSPLLLIANAGLFLARDQFISPQTQLPPSGSSEADALADLMDSYVRWLAGSPELALLMLISAYDRPADTDSLTHLLGRGHTPPSHPPLRDEWASWAHVAPDRWHELAGHLREIGLVLPGAGFVMEMHPLIHSCTAALFRRTLPARWKDTHRSLRDFLAAQPDDEFPETLEEIQPLCRAVYHGCQAGDYQKAFDEIGWPRIARGPRVHFILTTGLPFEALVTLGPFLQEGVSFPEDSDLSPIARGSVLHAAAVALGYLGRFGEARDFNRASIRYFKSDHTFLGQHLLLAAYALKVRLALYTGPLMRETLPAMVTLKSLSERVEPEPPRELINLADRHLWQVLRALSVSNAALMLDLAGRKTDAEAALKAFRSIADELGHGLLGEEGCQYFIGRFLLRRGRWQDVWEAVQRGETQRFKFAYVERGNVHELLGGWSQLEGCIAQNLLPDAPLALSANEWLDYAVKAARDDGILYRIAETLMLRARWHLHFGNPDDFLTDWRESRELALAQKLHLLLHDIDTLGCAYEAKHGTTGSRLLRKVSKVRHRLKSMF